jgi:hypothetical protein
MVPVETIVIQEVILLKSTFYHTTHSAITTALTPLATITLSICSEASNEWMGWGSCIEP